MNRDEQVKRNLELAGRFLEQMLDHPAMIEGVPDGGVIVLVPDDDSELVDANLQTARKLLTERPGRGETNGAAKGEHNREVTTRVILHAVGP